MRCLLIFHFLEFALLVFWVLYEYIMFIHESIVAFIDSLYLPPILIWIFECRKSTLLSCTKTLIYLDPLTRFYPISFFVFTLVYIGAKEGDHDIFFMIILPFQSFEKRNWNLWNKWLLLILYSVHIFFPCFTQYLYPIPHINFRTVVIYHKILKYKIEISVWEQHKIPQYICDSIKTPKNSIWP